MAWVTPRTWISGELVTASMMNGLRDSLNQTAPAKATASGDVFYATGVNAIARLAKGTDGQVLTLASGLPSWAASASAFLSSINVYQCSADGATTGDTTITSVTTSRAALILLGLNGNSPLADRGIGYATLTSGTNVRVTKTTASNRASLSIAVIEFKAGIIKTPQRGTTALGTASLTIDQTITAVTLARAFPSWLGSASLGANGTAADWIAALCTAQFTSTTNFRYTRGDLSSGGTGAYQVIEFEATAF
jgi:hypothetical protein